MISPEALNFAWFVRPGEWLRNTNGITFRVDFEAYKDFPTKSARLTIALVGGLGDDEVEAVIRTAHKAVGASLDPSVQTGLKGTIITWDARGPKAPHGVGKKGKES